MLMTMKKIMSVMMFVVMLITMNSCSADTAEASDDTITVATPSTNYNYNDSELETMKLINDYRISIGLNALQQINYISYKCEEHNKDMIAVNAISHNGFVARSEDIMKALSAKKIGENVAYNYKTAQAVLTGWLNSEGHKENIEGDYTHFGLSVTTDASGKKYYTNIFVKI